MSLYCLTSVRSMSYSIPMMITMDRQFNRYAYFKASQRQPVETDEYWDSLDSVWNNVACGRIYPDVTYRRKLNERKYDRINTRRTTACP